MKFKSHILRTTVVIAFTSATRSVLVARIKVGFPPPKSSLIKIAFSCVVPLLQASIYVMIASFLKSEFWVMVLELVRNLESWGVSQWLFYL
jgi:hypothetical protein